MSKVRDVYTENSIKSYKGFKKIAGSLPLVIEISEYRPRGTAESYICISHPDKIQHTQIGAIVIDKSHFSPAEVISHINHTHLIAIPRNKANCVQRNESKSSAVNYVRRVSAFENTASYMTRRRQLKGEKFQRHSSTTWRRSSTMPN